jgi:transcriptional regulator with XRE-family HTH domain
MRKSFGNQNAWLVALGEAIRRRRTECAVSQQDLALDAGVHRTYVSDIERGARNMTVLTLGRIAMALGTRTADLCKTADEFEVFNNKDK